MATNLDLSIVIPIYNDHEGLEAFLPLLLPAARALNVPYEILVVGDGSATPIVLRNVGCGSGSWGARCPRAMSVLSSRCAGCCRPRWAVRSSSSSGMTSRRGSQRASFGLNARGNEECRADTIGLAPVGRPKSTVDMLLSPATPEPPGQATRDIVRCQS
jgi:hypothetical protein